MKLTSMRLVLVAGLAGALATAAGCGGSSGTPADAGGGSGGGGTGGGAGGTGGTVVHLVNYTFDTTIEGFGLNTYCELMPAQNFNLAGACATDAGTDDAGSDAGAAAAEPTLTFESADGNPAAGSLKITATYTGYRQYTDVIINLPTPVDLTGKTLHAMVKLASSTPAGFPGGTQLHVNSPTYFSQSGQLVPNMWTSLAMPLDATIYPGIDPTMVNQIGVQVYSGDPPATGPAATFPFTIEYQVDTITD